MSARALVPAAALVLLALLAGLAWWLSAGDGAAQGREAGGTDGPAPVVTGAEDGAADGVAAASAGTAERLAAPERPGTAGTAALAGRVVDGAGEPLAGVEVSLTPAKVTTRALWSATTDDQGRFAFEGLPAGHTGLSALPEGAGVPEFAWVTLGQGERRGGVLLTLRRPARLTITVRGARGDPLPDQALRVRLWGGGLDPRAGALRQGFETDDQGRVVVEGLPAGTYEVLHSRWDHRAVITLGDDEQAALTLTNPMTRGVVGRLEGLAGGASDLHVRARPLEVEGEAAAQWSDLVGPAHFELALPAAGTWSVWAEGPVGGGSRPVVVEVPEQGLVDVRLRLESCGLGGRLTWDHDGSPAAGVRVSVTRVASEAGDQPHDRTSPGTSPFGTTVLTDATGRFRVEHLHPGAYRVQLGARPHGPRRAGPLHAPLEVELLDGERRLDLDAVVCRRASLTVSVEAPPGTRVTSEVSLLLRLVDAEGGRVARRWTRMGRRQSFEDLEPGPYQLILRDEAVTWGENVLRELSLDLGEHEQLERRLVLTREELLAAQQAALATEVTQLPAQAPRPVEDG